VSCWLPVALRFFCYIRYWTNTNRANLVVPLTSPTSVSWITAHEAPDSHPLAWTKAPSTLIFSKPDGGGADWRPVSYIVIVSVDRQNTAYIRQEFDDLFTPLTFHLKFVLGDCKSGIWPGIEMKTKQKRVVEDGPGSVLFSFLFLIHSLWTQVDEHKCYPVRLNGRTSWLNRQINLLNRNGVPPYNVKS